MIRFNTIGLGILFASALISLVVGSLLRADETINVVIGGSLMLIVDLIYRARFPQTNGVNKWLATQAGGFVALGPVWIMGIILIIFGLLAMVGVVQMP